MYKTAVYTHANDSDIEKVTDRNRKKNYEGQHFANVNVLRHSTDNTIDRTLTKSLRVGSLPRQREFTVMFLMQFFTY